jgi:hypothetical protein
VPRKSSKRPKVDVHTVPTLPPPRAGMPTSPVDLSEYAREATGPDIGDVNAREALELDLSGVPYIAVPRDRVMKLELDHRAGFLISLLDGVSTAEEILDMAGMPEEEALIAFYELHARGVIAFR